MAKRWVVAATLLVFTVIACWSVCAAVDLPDKLKDIPLYSGSKIVQAMDLEANAMATMTVRASHEEIAAFYKETLKGAGWKAVFQAQQEHGQMIQFQKGDKVLHLNVEKTEDATEATYNLIISGK